MKPPRRKRFKFFTKIQQFPLRHCLGLPPLKILETHSSRKYQAPNIILSQLAFLVMIQ